MPHNDVTGHSYSAIYHGTVRHARYMPKKHRFAYKVFSLLLDIDQLETLSKNLKLFSFNRFNIFSFRASDPTGPSKSCVTIATSPTARMYLLEKANILIYVMLFCRRVH